jgi:hypothetical protein
MDVASNLGCIGMASADASEFSSLVKRALPRAVSFGRVGGIELLRWDDGSGARVVFGMREGQVVDFLPSFAADPTTRLADVKTRNGDVATASVVDEAGDQLTSLAFELEQNRLLPSSPVATADASVVFLGRNITLHRDADAFGESPASLLDPAADADAAPPPHVVERGMKWPFRVGSESFFSYGVFGDAEDAQAIARFAGQVIAAESRTNQLTKQTFTVARIHTVGISATVCLQRDEVDAVPGPGQVVAGEAFVAVSIPALETAGTRERW